MTSQEAVSDSLEVQEEVRARIAARNKRRALKDKEYKLLQLVSGVHAYSAYICLTSALSIGISSAGNAVVSGVLATLGSLFAYVFIAIWRNKLPSIWLAILPSTIFVIVGVFFGAFLSPIFWLNAAAHIEIPFLYTLKKRLASLPS